MGREEKIVVASNFMRSCSNWSDLTDDLKAEILCRLPETSLIRSKLVSKSWRSLIFNRCVPRLSPPSAAAPLSGFLYRWQHYTSPGLFYDHAAYHPGFASRHDHRDGAFVRSYSEILPFRHDAEDLQDCCNGLVLIARRSSLPIEYYVCNPATRQCVAVPVNPSHRNPMFAALAFNPSESESASLGNFKVVRFDSSICHASVDDPPKLDVFNSETGLWVTHAVPMGPEVYGFSCVKRSIYLDGVLYLLSDARWVLCFDLKKHREVTARSIELPDKGIVENLGLLGTSRGRLYYSNHDGHTLCIWYLKNSDYWVPNRCVRINDLVFPRVGRLPQNRRAYFLFMPYAMHPTSEVIFLGILRGIYSYHIRTGRVELVLELDFDSMIPKGRFCVFPYSRSLVVLNDSFPKALLDPLSDGISGHEREEPWIRNTSKDPITTENVRDRHHHMHKCRQIEISMF